MQRQPTSAAADGITVHRFVDMLARKFHDSAASFSAMRLGGFTLVVARGRTAAELEQFVERDLGGEVQRPGAVVRGEAA